MKKGTVIALGVVLCLVLFLIVNRKTEDASPVPAPSGKPAGQNGKIINVQNERQALYAFIKTRMTGPFGVFTNLKETDEAKEAATGHEVLSESASLQMREDARSKRKEEFARHWALAKQTFDLKRGFSYRYSPKQQKKYPLNAAVDDLRMIRALTEAAKAFDEPAYAKEAEKYGKRFYETNVKDGKLYDFYDETYGITNKFVTLCYIDLRTLGMLPLPDASRQALLDNMKGLIAKGYLSDAFPFYETRFDYEKNAYTSEGINMVESLLTVLHLAEAGEPAPASIRYIKEHVKAGTLYGRYTKEGTPATQVQSTAIYAITAMIGSEIGDASLYQDSIQRMNAYQVKDEGSPLNGGFGDVASGQAYSFDNLMALLAYTY
ncbi:hypothetical protein ACI48J_00220 [Paenibacillus chitinolyticus]|uniref:hypothetical protein n=1 Tax=Paenibacillus chitinolyticus TaxID=79263 RepID=UPI003865CB38